MSLTGSARTHAGNVRAQNEDAAVCRPEHGLFAVVDGMGGQEAGEVAAAIAAAAIAEVPNVPGFATEPLLVSALKEARLRILRQAEKDPAQHDMGAVATVARLDDDGRALGLAHVGDTRAWLVGRRGVKQLTRDHVAGDAAGGKRPVSRDLGRRDMPEDWVETGRFRVSRGDILVLASDGLHDAVPEHELAAELQKLYRDGADADAVTARLVGLALAHGGPDNVTVVATRLGPFHRGRRRRRLPLALSVALLVALLGLAGVTLFGHAPPAPADLPDHVTLPTRLSPPATLAIEAGKTTIVDPGASLLLRGARVTGTDWTVDVGEGASLTLDLAAIDLSAGFTVRLADGASLEVTDTRVTAAAIRVVTAPRSHVTLRHVTLAATGTDGPAFEGPVPPAEEDVRRLGADAP